MQCAIYINLHYILFYLFVKMRLCNELGNEVKTDVH